MSIMEEYKKKLITAEQAAKLVKSGDWVQYGEFVQQPLEIDQALAARKDELKDVKIRTTTFAYMPEVCKVDPAGESFCFNDWHFSGVTRKLHGEGSAYYISLTYHEVPEHYKNGYDEVDVIYQPVTPMDEHGYFNISTSNSIYSAAWDVAKTKVVYVNKSAPWVCGGCREIIHISDVDYIVESQTNHPLAALPEIPPTDADKKIAELILGTMHDGDCIQLGIGGMPNAVGAMIAQSDLKDLGVHTEMLADAYVDMFNSGRITGKKKQIDNGKMVFTFAMGSKKLYEFMDHNPVCATYPVNYTNQPSVISQNDNMVCINNAIEVDIFGQIASEASAGRQISGTGGQLDFVFASYKSKGGRGFVALTSTVKGKDGHLVSRIVPGLQPGTIVTVPRSLAYYIVTEYGIFNTKGMSSWQRAEGIINIAHPDFRDDLIKQAEKFKIWRRSNKI